MNESIACCPETVEANKTREISCSDDVFYGSFSLHNVTNERPPNVLIPIV